MVTDDFGSRRGGGVGRGLGADEGVMAAMVQFEGEEGRWHCGIILI